MLLLINTCLGDYKIIWMVFDRHQEKRLNMSLSHMLFQNLKNFTSVASMFVDRWNEVLRSHGSYIYYQIFLLVQGFSFMIYTLKLEI